MNLLVMPKIEVAKLYFSGKISREQALEVFKTPQGIAKYTKKLGYSYKTHIMTNKGFISKTDSIWKEHHQDYMENKKTLQDIGNLYGFTDERIRTIFVDLGFERKSIEKIVKAREIKYLEHYGVRNPSQAKEVKESKINTCQERYDKGNPFQVEEIKDQIVETNIEKYGYKCSLKNLDIKEKAINTLKLKLGVDNPSKSKEIQEKKKKNHKEKTGYDYLFETPKFIEENKKRGNPAQNSIIQQKISNTNLNRYGFPCALQNEEIILKRIKTRLENKAERIIPILKNIGYELLESYSGLETKEGSKHLKWKKYKLRHNCGHVFQDDIFRMPRCSKCYPIEECRSQLEYIIENYIKELGEKTEHGEKILIDKKNKKHYDIDVFIPNKNIGFEINGLYYHSIHNLGKNNINDKQYHSKKNFLAKEQNINLYFIWEHMDLNIVYSKIKLILNKIDLKIQARKTIFKEISKEETNIFLNNNHLYGSAIFTKAYGLFYNEEIIQVITYLKTKDTNTIEIKRSASKTNLQIIGGFSKLLKNSLVEIKKLGYNKLITYADKDWSPDPYQTVYFKNNFCFLGDTGPSLFFTKKFKQVFSRQKFQKHKLQKLFPETYQENLTEIENLALQKIYPFYTSGNWKFSLDI